MFGAIRRRSGGEVGHLIEELQRRDVVGDGTLARGPGMPEGDTLATFYYALAVDALVTEEAAIAAQWEALGG